MKIKFSVIINCYNSENFLEECISSVLKQTETDFEIILVNNQSTDNTKQIIYSFDDRRIRYFETPYFKTLGDARNFGLENAKGQYIGFLDSDDFWDKNKLKRSYKFLKNQKIGMVYSDVLYFNINHNFKLYSKRKPYEGNIFESLLEDYSLCLSSVIFSKKLINNYNIKFEDSFKVCEDFDFFIKISKYCISKYDPECLVYYRIHDNNLTKSKRELFFEEKNRFLLNIDGIDENFRKTLITQNQIEKSIYYWKIGRPNEASNLMSDFDISNLNKIKFKLLFKFNWEVVKKFLPKSRSIFD